VPASLAPGIEIGVVRRNERVAPDVRLLTFAAPGIARSYRPGTFVHLRTGDSSTPLRRPFSIARVAGDEVILLFRVIGAGTGWLGACEPGDRIDAAGPLGTPFTLVPASRRVFLVAGGLGLAPLLGLADELRATGGVENVDALFGVRTEDEIPGPGLIDPPGGPIWRIASDDGSAGFTGTVVDLLEERLGEMAANGGEDSLSGLTVYASGPVPMLEAAAGVAAARGVDLQVSMEAHMACGVGACRACGIVAWKDRARINGRVCREGPVFDASEILWEEVGR
jgi:dihydroorotate dehydrogenase electron transfer subunit